jgi:hypothetical protein
VTTPAPSQSAPSLTGAGEASTDLLSDGQNGPGPRSETVQDHVQSDDGQQSRCRYRRRDGSPCRSFATYPDIGCIAHSQDPKALDARRQGSARGGHGRSNLRRACKIVAAGPYAHLADVLARAAQEVYEGQLDPQRGHALANLARGIVVVADAALVSDRLAELEAEVSRIRSGDVGETFSRPTT